MMGCGSSMESGVTNEDHTNGLKRWQQNDDPVRIIQEFIRLDEQISKLEAACPGPRMATIEAWIEHLQAKRNTLGSVDLPPDSMVANQISEADNRNAQQPQQQQAKLPNVEVLTLNETGPALGTQLPTNGFTLQQNSVTPMANGVGVLRNTNDIVTNTPTEDLANLAVNLGVIGDVQKASTHEDFFANLSESALFLQSIKYYTEILEHTKKRLITLTERYAELNEHYVNHDGIIAFISGGTYMSRLEEALDAQLEIARDVRDKLGSALEQWRISGTLLRACANSATQGLQQWRNFQNILDPRQKINAVLECRNTFHASLISLDCAQLALPHVDIKFVSNRQILAVNHCNTYMITDIVNQLRYEHSSKVFASYESNMSKAAAWLYETFDKTLRKDFEKAEDAVRELARSLRDHRQEIFTAARK